MTMANILPFQPRQGESCGPVHGLDAEIILFPGVRYEKRNGKDEPNAARTCDKVADALEQATQ